MARINGSVIGQSNRPNINSALGVWGQADIDNARRIGAWPLALSTTIIAMGASNSAGSNYQAVYPWSNITGFGTRYANPASLPTGQAGSDINFNPDGTTIAICTSDTAASPYIFAYPWSSNGYGTKYANPATLPTANVLEVNFSPDGAQMALATTVATNAGPAVYPWTNLGGYGTKYSQPATGGTAGTGGVNFSPDGSAIGTAATANPYIRVWAWSGSTGFGSQYASPATIPAGAGYSIFFNPDGVSVALGTGSSTPGVNVYAWSSATGLGSRYANAAPSTNFTVAVRSITFSPQGTTIVAGSSTTPFIHAWPWSSVTGYGTKYSNPATLPAGQNYGVSFSPDGAVLATTAPSSTQSIYPWSVSTGYGTRYSQPATSVTTQGGVSFTTIKA